MSSEKKYYLVLKCPFRCHSLEAKDRILIIPMLFSYGGHIWITNENIVDINKLWYHILKSITGAVLNINQSIAEIILGIPPIQIQTQINCIKHFLKVNNQQIQNDRYKEFLMSTYDEPTKSPESVHRKNKDLFKFLEWKMELCPSHFTPEDIEIVSGNHFSSFLNLSDKSCTYTKTMMTHYTDTVLWQNRIRNQFQLDGYASAPAPSSDKLPVPPNTPRKVEVLLMSLFYKNNILNQTLWNLGKVPSPLCSLCSQQEETAEHILFQCSAVDESLRSSAINHYRRVNSIEDGDDATDTYIGLLNACKDRFFIEACMDIIANLDLRMTVEL